MLLDARTFQNEATEEQIKACKQGGGESINSSFPTLEAGGRIDGPSKLRSAVELAEWAVRRTVGQAEAFEFLYKEICMILEKVGHSI